MSIQLNQFPQLRLIACNMRVAFGIYERNWRFVEQAQLLTHERALIARPAIAFGAGVLNV